MRTDKITTEWSSVTKTTWSKWKQSVSEQQHRALSRKKSNAEPIAETLAQRMTSQSMTTPREHRDSFRIPAPSAKRTRSLPFRARNTNCVWAGRCDRSIATRDWCTTDSRPSVSRRNRCRSGQNADMQNRRQNRQQQRRAHANASRTPSPPRVAPLSAFVSAANSDSSIATPDWCMTAFPHRAFRLPLSHAEQSAGNRAPDASMAALEHQIVTRLRSASRARGKSLTARRDWCMSAIKRNAYSRGRWLVERYARRRVPLSVNQAPSPPSVVPPLTDALTENGNAQIAKRVSSMLAEINAFRNRMLHAVHRVVNPVRLSSQSAANMATSCRSTAASFAIACADRGKGHFARPASFI